MECIKHALKAQSLMAEKIVHRKAAGSGSFYIINCRISKEKELLVKGNSVEEACGKSGFNNLSHFSRTFKNKVGMSPKQYQQSVRKIS